MKLFFCVVAAMLLAYIQPASAAVDAGRFQVLHIKSAGNPPLGLAFVISDVNGWDATAEAGATALQQDGWLTVGLDLVKYRDSLRRGTDKCHDVGDELIALSQHLQRDYGINSYQTPVLVGYGQGGVLAYAAIKQALPASFTAGVALGGTNRLDLPKKLCDGPAAKRERAGASYTYDTAPALKVPFARLNTNHANDIAAALKPYQKAPAQDSIADLPLVTLPPVDSSIASFVILISGDGGWRDIDKQLAEYLHAHGVGIVGWDSLRYFWSQKTPEQFASDLGRVMTHYSQLWRKPTIVLAGYSFGADVLPATYNHLPVGLQQQVRKLQLLSPGKNAAFEIEVEGYIGLDRDTDQPLAPELLRVPADKILCIAGQEDLDDSSCPTLQTRGADTLITRGGHHFDEDYNIVASKLFQDL